MEITVVGLTPLGTALALALQAAHEDIAVIGHDPDPERATRAKQLGAIDRSEWNLPAACAQSGIILLDIPLEELRRTLQAIGDSVAPDVVIIDLAPVKRPVLAFAKEVLPHPERFVGGHLLPAPRALGGDEPSAEQIRAATFYLVASPETSAQALDIASDLAVAVGAVPRYIDAVEHDGLMAATGQLPVVASAGIVGTLATAAGDQERGDAAGPAVAALRLVLGEGIDAATLVGNADNLLYWIDRYVVELQRLRRLVAEEERSGLAEALSAASETLARWTASDDETQEPAEARHRGGALRDLLLGGLGRSRTGR